MASGVPQQAVIRLNGHALQCLVTTEDPENNFTPDYGRLTAYRSASGFGIRLDGGTAYSGAVITPYYDSLLVKVTAWAPTSDEAISRMDRALREFRIRGVSTNLPFLENVINHPLFKSGECITRFIDTTPELFHFAKRRDRATRLLRFIGEVAVNGNPEMKGRKLPDGVIPPAILPPASRLGSIAPGSRDRGHRCCAAAHNGGRPALDGLIEARTGARMRCRHHPVVVRPQAPALCWRDRSCRTVRNPSLSLTY